MCDPLFRLGFLGLRRSGVPVLSPVGRCGTRKSHTFEQLGIGLRESPCENLGRNREIAPEALPPPDPGPAPAPEKMGGGGGT